MEITYRQLLAAVDEAMKRKHAYDEACNVDTSIALSRSILRKRPGGRMTDDELKAWDEAEALVRQRINELDEKIDWSLT